MSALHTVTVDLRDGDTHTIVPTIDPATIEALITNPPHGTGPEIKQPYYRTAQHCNAEATP